MSGGPMADIPGVGQLVLLPPPRYLTPTRVPRVRCLCSTQFAWSLSLRRLLTVPWVITAYEDKAARQNCGNLRYRWFSRQPQCQYITLSEIWLAVNFIQIYFCRFHTCFENDTVIREKSESAGGSASIEGNKEWHGRVPWERVGQEKQIVEETQKEVMNRKRKGMKGKLKKIVKLWMKEEPELEMFDIQVERS